MSLNSNLTIIKPINCFENIFFKEFVNFIISSNAIQDKFPGQNLIREYNYSKNFTHIYFYNEINNVSNKLLENNLDFTKLFKKNIYNEINNLLMNSLDSFIYQEKISDFSLDILLSSYQENKILFINEKYKNSLLKLKDYCNIENNKIFFLQNPVIFINTEKLFTFSYINLYDLLTIVIDENIVQVISYSSQNININHNIKYKLIVNESEFLNNKIFII